MPCAHNSKSMQQVGYAKFTLEKWGAIEVKLDQFSMLVLRTIAPLGEQVFQQDHAKVSFEHGLQMCGDQIYETIIRPKLVASGIVDKTVPSVVDDEKGKGKKDKEKEKKGGGGKGKPGGKKSVSRADEIRLKNVMSKTNDAVEEMLSSLKRSKKPDFGFKSNYAELRLSTLMFCAAQALDRHRDRAVIYELIVGISKALHVLREFVGISGIALADAKKWVSKLKTLVRFAPQTVFNSYPRLILSTDYDRVFPQMSVKPYKSQVELMEGVKSCGKKSGLIFYNAMIGAGKTTSVVPLAMYCRALRNERRAAEQKKTKINPQKPQFPQIMFCCSVEPVRNQVATLAFNMQIPFGISTLEDEREDNVKIRNHFNCPSHSDRELIVSDLITTEILLKQAENKDDYILFLDEPTVAADVAGHKITEFVAKILKIAPSITILSSATMPPPNEVPLLKEMFCKVHPQGKVVTINSREAQIGCEVITSTGNTLFPHTGCTSVEELNKIIRVLEENAFLGRLYTAPAVYRLRQRLEDLKIPNLPDLNSAFEDISKLSQIYIQEVARILLHHTAATNDDQIVEKACQSIPSGLEAVSEKWEDDAPEEKDESEEEDSDAESGDEDVVKVSAPRKKPDEEFEIIFEGVKGGDDFEEPVSTETESKFRFTPRRLFTQFAHRYLGGCLVTVEDPYSFGALAAKSLLEETPQFGKALKKYNAALSNYLSKLEKTKASMKDEEELNRTLQDIEENEKPKLDFPSYCQINTRDHLKKYAPKEFIETMDRKMRRGLLVLENLPFADLGVPEWVTALLFCGVGIYHPKHDLLNQRYEEVILDMASKGQLAFLISDSSISYGANYPFYHVIIEDEMAKKRSMKTIFQLMGRAGRIGKSWTARVHLMGPYLEQRIKEYVKGSLLGEISDEAKNLNEALKTVMDSK